jgi:quercetin dioxygenase-like cupin family protein
LTATALTRGTEREAVAVGELSTYRVTPAGAEWVEALVGTLAAGGRARYPGTDGEGEEAMLVVSGEVTASVGDDHWILRAGDCLLYPRSASRSFRAGDDRAAEVLWLTCPARAR